jgi:hypothetical protein
LGIGEARPEEVEVMIGPHRRARMPGSTRSATTMTESIMQSKYRRQVSGDCPITGPGRWAAGDRHEDVDGPERRLDPGEVALDGTGIGQIPWNLQHPAARSGRGSLGRGTVHVGGRDPRRCARSGC